MTIENPSSVEVRIQEARSSGELPVPAMELQDQITSIVEEVTGFVTPEEGRVLSTDPYPIETYSGQIYMVSLSAWRGCSPGAAISFRASDGVTVKLQTYEYPNSSIPWADARAMGDVIEETRRLIEAGQLVPNRTMQGT